MILLRSTFYLYFLSLFSCHGTVWHCVPEGSVRSQKDTIGSSVCELGEESSALRFGQQGAPQTFACLSCALIFFFLVFVITMCLQVFPLMTELSVLLLFVSCKDCILITLLIFLFCITLLCNSCFSVILLSYSCTDYQSTLGFFSSVYGAPALHVALCQALSA